MRRRLSIAAYLVGCLLAAYLALVSFQANSRFPFGWGAESVVWLFLPLLVALVSALIAQLRVSRFLLGLALGVVISASLLLLSALSHMFPARSTPLSVAHLVSVGGLLWLSLRAYRRNNEA